MKVVQKKGVKECPACSLEIMAKKTVKWNIGGVMMKETYYLCPLCGFYGVPGQEKDIEVARAQAWKQHLNRSADT